MAKQHIWRLLGCAIAATGVGLIMWDASLRSLALAAPLIATGGFLAFSAAETKISRWVGFALIGVAALIEFAGPNIFGRDAGLFILYGGIALACVGVFIAFPPK